MGLEFHPAGVLKTMGRPLSARVYSRGFTRPTLLKVVDVDAFVAGRWSPAQCALLLDKVHEPHQARMTTMPWAAVLSESAPPSGAWISIPKSSEIISPGDVILVQPDSPTLRMLYRRGERGNVLFATERCNSFCLMCSQPPREIGDAWRIDLNLALIPLIDPEEVCLAITGGEPTLLGDGIVRLIAACKQHLRDTELQVLTNGRKFASTNLAQTTAELEHPRLQWNVPLYADVTHVHDYIVQSEGAFDETTRGLIRLAESGHQIEIRVVLHRATISRLKSLARFIYRNLSFVRHVAWMGLEPIGFALANRKELWIDPADYQSELMSAVSYLATRGIRTSIYNLPLCVLPDVLRPFARQSISDWKNTFLPCCQSCGVRSSCSGFFASTDEQWISRAIRPLGAGGANERSAETPAGEARGRAIAASADNCTGARCGCRLAL